jgi:hypothetical protein
MISTLKKQLFDNLLFRRRSPERHAISAAERKQATRNGIVVRNLKRFL